MLIAIAADLHDNLANWKKFNQYAKKQAIESLLFCGDLCNEDSLIEMSQSFNGKIYLIAGNQELYDTKQAEKHPNIHFIGRYGHIVIDQLKIGLAHEPEYRDKLKKELPNLNYLFYGHTHKPWIEQESNLIIANPGTLGGVFYEATFALLNTTNNNLELKLLNQII
jgi:putative phosphoesterase